MFLFTYIKSIIAAIGMMGVFYFFLTGNIPDNITSFSGASWFTIFPLFFLIFLGIIGKDKIANLDMDK